MPHLVATLIYLSQNYLYYIRGDRSPLKQLLGMKCVFKHQDSQIISFNLLQI